MEGSPTKNDYHFTFYNDKESKTVNQSATKCEFNNNDQDFLVQQINKTTIENNYQNDNITTSVESPEPPFSVISNTSQVGHAEGGGSGMTTL